METKPRVEMNPKLRLNSCFLPRRCMSFTSWFVSFHSEPSPRVTSSGEVVMMLASPLGYSGCVGHFDELSTGSIAMLDIIME
jgi:hypothetical protein